MATSYEKALNRALSDLGVLVRRRAAIDHRISELRNVVLALYAKTRAKGQKEKLMTVLGQMDAEGASLTDAVKDALYAADRSLPATQVRDVMELHGFSFAGLVNPLASVHSTLRRLAAQGDIKAATKMGETVYEWSGPRYGARKSLANILAERELAGKMDAKRSLPRASRPVLKKRQR